MDPTVLAQLLHALNLDQWLPVLLALHMLASALDNALPQPAPGSHWLPIRKLLTWAALNFNNAANATQPPLITWLQRVIIQLAAVVPEPPAGTPLAGAPAPPATALPAAAPATPAAPVASPWGSVPPVPPAPAGAPPKAG